MPSRGSRAAVPLFALFLSLALLVQASPLAARGSPQPSGRPMGPAQLTLTIELPTITIQIPTVTIQIPTVTIQIPTVTVVVPTVTVVVPTVTLLPGTPSATAPPPGSPTATPHGGGGGGGDPSATPPLGLYVGLHLCGEVTGYTAATGTTTGLLTLDGRPVVLAAGSELINDHLLDVGSDVCVTAEVDLTGRVTRGVVDARAVTSLNLCGRITAYQAATETVAGSVAIAGRTVAIAPGTQLQGRDLLAVGNDVCVSGTLDATGRLNDGSVTTNLGARGEVSVCGEVGAFQAATAGAPGSVVIGGQTVPIAAGTTLVGQELLRAGSSVCLRGTLNAAGELRDGEVRLGTGATVHVCGRVAAFQAATAQQDGWLSIGGQDLVIDAGTVLDGQDRLRVGADVCLTASLSAEGEVEGGSVSAGAQGGLDVNLCGQVTAFQAAGSRVPGSITISGQTVSIAPGTALVGQDAIDVGSDFCLAGHLDAAGALEDGTITASGGTSVRLCGRVEGFQAAQSSEDGWLRLGGQTFLIASGTRLTGENLLREGADVCVTAQLDATGRIRDGAVSASGSAGTRVELCGSLSAFQAATASTPGSITLGGRTLPIAAGTHLDGQDMLRLGSDYCLVGQLDAQGRLQDGSLEASASTRIQLCGEVSAFQAARAQMPGSITIAGQTFAIAAGTELLGQDAVQAGGDYCLSAGLDAEGRVADGSIQAAASSTGEINLCGDVSALQAAQGASDGLITIAGRTLAIAAGTELDGADEVDLGSHYCLSGTIGANGKLVDGRLIASGQARLCGVITAMGQGSVMLDGRTFELAPGAQMDAGAGVCAAACVEIDSAGRVARLTVDGGASVDGLVTSYVPGRSIGVDGRVFQLADGARVDTDVRVGAEVSLSLNGAGEAVCVGRGPGPNVATATAPAPGPTVTPGGSGPVPAPAPGRSTICGIVYDAVTLLPIGGATVELFGAAGVVQLSRMTGPNGAYCFYDQPPGTYTVIGTHPRYDPDMKVVTAPPNVMTWIDLYLPPRAGGGPEPSPTPGGIGTPVRPITPPPAPTARSTPRPGAPTPTAGSLCPYVYRADDYRPIVGAIVQVFYADGSLAARGVTGADGHRCFSGLKPGPVTVVVGLSDCPRSPACESRLVRADVVAGEVRRVDVELECRGTRIFLPWVGKGAMILTTP